MFPGLPIHITLVLILASYLVLTSLVMLWAGLGKTHWFWRAMGAVGWVGLFVFARAGEVAVLTASLAVLIIVPCYVVRGLFAWRTKTLRFGMRDILLAAVPVAIFFAMDPGEPEVLSPAAVYTTAIAVASLSLALAWLAFGTRWWALRVIVACSLVCSIFVVILNSGTWLSSEEKLLYTWMNFAPTDATGRPYMLGPALWLVLTFVAWHVIGLMWARRTANEMDLWRVRKKFGVMAIVLLPLPLLFVGWTYWRMLTFVPDLVADYPSPNSYEDIRRFYSTLGTIENRPHWQSASDTEIDTFVTKYQDEIMALRAALAEPGMVVLRKDDNTYVEMQQIWTDSLRINGLHDCLLLLAESKSGDERTLIVRDLLRLAETTARGSLTFDVIVAQMHRAIAIEILYEALNDMSPDVRQELLAELHQMELRRESLADLQLRDWTYDIHQGDWTKRVVWAADDFSGSDYYADQYKPFEAAFAEDLTYLRLLRIELALRCYYHDHRRWPTTLTELAPSYLESVPIDPFGDRPLIYRRSETKYVLYSLGEDRDDDGGAMDANLGGNGDIRLDVFALRRELARKQEAEAATKATP